MNGHLDTLLSEAAAGCFLLGTNDCCTLAVAAAAWKGHQYKRPLDNSTDLKEELDSIPFLYQTTFGYIPGDIILLEPPILSRGIPFPNDKPLLGVVASSHEIVCKRDKGGLIPVTGRIKGVYRCI